MIHRKLFFIFLLSLSACGITPPTHPDFVSEIPSAGNGNENTPSLHIKILDIGQGDATLLETPDGHTLLIDAGPKDTGQNIILPEIQFAEPQLTALFLSHYDADHMGSALEVLSGPDGELHSDDDVWPTMGIFDRGEENTPDTATYTAYSEASENQRHTVSAGDHWQIDGLTIDCIVANARIQDHNGQIPLFPGETLAENEQALGLLIQYGKFRYWTGGDLPGSSENDAHDVESAIAPLIAASGPVDLLHLHHHGSRHSTNTAFLKALQPKAALISAGDENTYGHPTRETIDRLHQANVDIYATHTYDDRQFPDIEIVHNTIVIDVKTSGEFNVNGRRYEASN